MEVPLYRHAQCQSVALCLLRGVPGHAGTGLISPKEYLVLLVFRSWKFNNAQLEHLLSQFIPKDWYCSIKSSPLL